MMTVSLDKIDRCRVMTSNEDYLRQAIALAEDNVCSGRGGPFGALVVRNDQVLATGSNLVTATNDPTAHAEMIAIRAACQAIGSYSLAGCDVYASCEPCSMCLSAIYWSRARQIYFASTREDAAEAGFDDAKIYREVAVSPEVRSIPCVNLLRMEGMRAFRKWIVSGCKIDY